MFDEEHDADDVGQLEHAWEGPFTKSGWTFRVVNWTHSREHSDLIYDNICIS